jgi:arabinogalactan oligomer/maltooligosaccharide transport system permease protein
MRRARRRLGQVGVQLALAGVALFVLVPIWNIAVMAFDGSLSARPEDLRLFPREPSLAMFADVFVNGTQDLPFLGLLRNSLVVSGGAAVVSLALGLTMAYAFARIRFPGREVGLVALLVGTLLPPVALLTPLFVLLSALHLRTTQLGLVVVYASLSMPLCVWLMRSAFRAVPADVEEAVLVEGGGLWDTFRHVSLPIAAPSIAIAVLLAFLVGYSEFALGWLFVDRGDQVTLAMAMAGSDIGMSSPAWARQAALTLLMAAPVVAVFLVLRRSLLSDVRLGITND